MIVCLSSFSCVLNILLLQSLLFGVFLEICLKYSLLNTLDSVGSTIIRSNRG
jgi:hypothetical protein